MSYLVMARRWRPQTFEEVIGQEHVTRTLQHAIKRGRVAHAYIFTGPRGVGKTTCARLLAKAINCGNLDNGGEGLPEPCNRCPSCNDITSGNALDVIEIDGASNNKVDDVRSLRESIKFSPASLSKKVYIIDEVHMLSPSAFNALLKTLEEPPDHAMFIFATTEIHKVPATVLSRCQRFDFKRIPTRGILQQLNSIVQGDKLAVDDEALTMIAVKAEGALRDALSILDQLVAYQGDEPITGEVVRRALGLIALDLFFQATDVAASGEVHRAIELADTIAAGGHDPREFLHGFQRHILQLLYLKAGGDEDELDVSEPYRERYREAAGGHSDEDLLRMGEWAAETEDLLREALDPQMRLELFLVRLARMDRAVEIGALLERLGVAPGSFKQEVKRPERGAGEAKQTDSPGETAGKRKSASKKEEPAGQTAEVAPAEGTTVEPRHATGSESPEDDDLDDDEEVEGEDSPAKESPELELSHIRTKWLEFCDCVERERRSLGPLLEKGAPVALQGGLLDIMFGKEDGFAFDQVKSYRSALQRASRHAFGETLKFRIVSGEIPKEARPPRRKTKREEQIELFHRELEKRPVWKQAVERLNLRFDD